MIKFLSILLGVIIGGILSILIIFPLMHLAFKFNDWLDEKFQ